MQHLLSHLLPQTAGAHGDRPAIEIGGAQLTYAELAHLAAQFARVLHDEGLRPGDRVGVHMKKSLEAVVALFGSLHAGCVFVPLDPSAPPSRTAYVLDNCDVKALVTTADKLALLEAETSRPLRAILVGKPAASAEPAGEPRKRPPLDPAPLSWADVEGAPEMAAPARRISHDLAYILYTSGSTGVPKGVMISHLAAMTFVRWGAATVGLTPDDVVSNHAPFHFDLSTFDLYASVMSGSRVVLLPEWASAFPGRLVQTIAEREISVWYSVPSALILMMSRGKLAERSFPALRAILFAGEVFPMKHLRALREIIPHARLLNLYGPTETNVCTYHEVGELAADRTEPLPIGRAIDEHEVFAVTPDGRLAAQGEEGELWARGPGLMSGYFGLPERTAKVLHDNPFMPDVADRVYRTGDLVVQQPDGEYAFRGRIDHMVKIKGYRVELGEVESTIYSHPAVREAAVLATGADGVDTQLEAFVVCTDPELDGQALSVHCAARIPKYMVPEIFEIVGSLPKTSTGKIDRQALAASRAAKQQSHEGESR